MADCGQEQTEVQVFLFSSKKQKRRKVSILRQPTGSRAICQDDGCSHQAKVIFKAALCI